MSEPTASGVVTATMPQRCCSATGQGNATQTSVLDRAALGPQDFGSPAGRAEDNFGRDLQRPRVVTQAVGQRLRALSVTGSCAYVLGFGIPFSWDVPLAILAGTSAIAAMSGLRGRPVVRPPLDWPVVLFLVVTGCSIAVAADAARSARLCVSLLPAVLLYLNIASYFDGVRDIRKLYVAFSCLGIGLAAVLLLKAWLHPGTDPSVLVSSVGSPILLVPNDLILLAVVTPVSFAVLQLETGKMARTLAVLSIILGLCAICVVQSRGGLLTMAVSVVFMGALCRTRIAVVLGCALLILGLFIDWAQGFPLVSKFSRSVDPRIALWLSAWAMFLDAPLLGHGPHTFSVFYQGYLQGLNLPSWLPVDTRVVPWAHSLYLETLAEQGIVGLAGMVLLIGCGVWLALRAARSAFPEVRVLAAGALAAMVSLCFAAMFELTLLRHWVAIAMFALLGVIARLSAVGSGRWEESS